VPKRQVWTSQNPEFPAKKFNRRIFNHSMFVIQTSKIPEAHTQEGAIQRMKSSAQACCMIEGWDPKLFLKRVRMQAVGPTHCAVADLQSLSFAMETA